MKIVLLGDISGSRNGEDWPRRGSTVDLPDDEAAALCQVGMARPVTSEPVETEAAVPLTTDVAAAVVPSRPSRRGRPPSES